MKTRARWIGFYALLAAGCAGNNDDTSATDDAARAAAGDGGGTGGSAGASTVDGSTPAECDAHPVETGDPRFDALMRDLEAWRQAEEHTWLAVAIVEDGRATHRAVLGRAGTDRCEPMTDRHVFHLHNVTRVLTDVAALRSGKLDLDAPITEYIPEIQLCEGEVEEWLGRVTVRGVFDRTAGFFPGYKRECERHDGYFERTCARVGFEPGTAWSNSVPATVALAVALERVTDQPFELAMKQELFEPLGMLDATYEPLPAGALYAEPTPGVPATVYGAPCAEAVAEYSVLASLRDMHLYAEAILKPELIDRIFLGDEAAFAPGGQRAVVFQVSPLAEHETLAIMGGAFPIGADIAVIPERRFAVVTAGAGTFGRDPALIKRVLEAYGIGPTTDDLLPKDRWWEYEGTYATRDGSLPLEVWYDAETQTLWARDPGSTDPGLELIPTSEAANLWRPTTQQRDVFALPGWLGAFPHTIRFYRDDSGIPTRIVSWNGEFDVRYRQ
jgi:CubicO group peptidase (beta-lactamase class C family)